MAYLADTGSIYDPVVSPQASSVNSEWGSAIIDMTNAIIPLTTLVYGSEVTGQTLPGGGYGEGLIPTIQSLQDQSNQLLAEQSWAMVYGQPVFDDASVQAYYDLLNARIAAGTQTAQTQARSQAQAVQAVATAQSRQQGVGVTGQLDLNKVLPWAIGGAFLFIYMNRSQQRHF
jgi:hypothetical protein